MKTLRCLIKKCLPACLLHRYQTWRFARAHPNNRFAGKTVTEIFTVIYENKHWRGGRSISGPGSDLSQTEAIRRALPALLREWGVQTLLDIPCGDFGWMSQVDLQDIYYIGGDIVPSLVARTRAHHAGPCRAFQQIDLLEDDLPKVDLVLVRDCLVHFSFADIEKALANLKRSGSRYVLMTSFSGDRVNEDIQTGNWRPLNFQKAPFFLPKPLAVIEEGCTEQGGVFADKCLMLWELARFKNV